ncbi:MAG TPA: [Fe-Fe] hydrogenase large subunit C-terminal domain-containing protein [Gemmatimonadaceae bacterium]|nr:[Fe-Fe] hydrogenase large subunit C-terminal domain-containing protein [Gemmatimonadaceae bacterium]
MPFPENSAAISYEIPAIAVLGPDAVIAAAPATQAQLIAACGDLGFDAVVPGSWGDELIAEATLRHLGPRSRESVVLCACPSTHAAANGDSRLTRHVLSLVSPGVAAARYLRMLYAPTRVRITYVGDCAGTADGELDQIWTVATLLEALTNAGKDPGTMPDDAAPGHRRYLSLPGGAPHPAALRQAVRHELVVFSGEDSLDRASAHLERGSVSLIDLAPATECGCAGGPARSDISSRALLATLEPPRATGDVLSPTIRPDLTTEVTRTTSRYNVPPIVQSHGSEREVQLPAVAFGAPFATPVPPSPRRRARISGVMRAIGGPAPATRTGEGLTLPRAYLSHRSRRADDAAHPSPPGGMAEEHGVALGSAPLADASPPRRSSGASLVVRLPYVEPYRVPPPPSRAASIRHIAYFVIAVAMLITLILATAG